MTERPGELLVLYSEAPTVLQQIMGEPGFSKFMVKPNHEPGEFVDWFLEQWPGGLNVWTTCRSDSRKLIDIICLPKGITPCDIAGEASERGMSLDEITLDKARNWFEIKMNENNNG